MFSCKKYAKSICDYLSRLPRLASHWLSAWHPPDPTPYIKGSPPSMDGAQDLAAGEVCDDYTPQQISDQLVLAKATKVLHK